MSSQQKDSRVRPARIQISLEPHTDGASEAKELPFIMGVMGDFSGQPRPGSIQSFEDRKFVEVTPQSFNSVLKDMRPHLDLSVRDTLSKDPDAKRMVSLDFERLEDFAPERIAQRVPELADLLELRGELANLRSALQTDKSTKRKLDELLTAGGALTDAEKLTALRAELGLTEETNG